MEPHKIVGYALLALGLIVVIIPMGLAISILSKGTSAIPKIIVAPVVTINSSLISASSFNQLLGSIFPAVNLCLLFVLSLVMIYAGGVIMSRGVSLTKEIKLKAVGEAVKETNEDIEVKKEEATKTEKQ